jgi:molybdopterin-containing oxidoreductase family iron-sulfur binding subunit
MSEDGLLHRSVEANPVDQLASLQDLVKDLDAGAVDVLLVLSGNPVFTSPVEIGMKDRIQKARMRIHLGLYHDETSAVCQWHLPERICSKPGAMHGRSTARSASSSR